MIFTAPLIGAAVLFSGFASALPHRRDSAVGEEVAVSAPNGIPLTDTIELSSQLASEASTAPATQVTDSSSSSSSGSGYGSGSNYGAGSNSGSNNGYGYSAAVTTTSSAWSSYSTPSYGSGSSNWGGSSYDDCVSQCLATYGSPPSLYMPPSSTVESSGSSGGNGVTHTVIVAPTQGVLRYMPFAVNASIGDTVKFMWGANNHTVTKSSTLELCNKSGDALFTSGSQNKDFVFTQVVNDTNPTYFHCGTPGHCQKGMFGVINPTSAFGMPTSFSGMIQDMSSQSPDIAAYASYTTQQTADKAAASKWGGNIDLSALPDWAQPMAAENILYTRNFLAQNAEVLKDDGSIDLSSAGSTPLMIPQDVGAALNNAAASPSASSSISASSADPTTSSTTAAANSNGASSLASPKAVVAFVAVLATFFAL